MAEAKKTTSKTFRIKNNTKGLFIINLGKAEKNKQGVMQHVGFKEKLLPNKEVHVDVSLKEQFEKSYENEIKLKQLEMVG